MFVMTWPNIYMWLSSSFQAIIFSTFAGVEFKWHEVRLKIHIWLTLDIFGYFKKLSLRRSVGVTINSSNVAILFSQIAWYDFCFSLPSSVPWYSSQPPPHSACSSYKYRNQQNQLHNSKTGSIFLRNPKYNKQF